MTKEIHENWEWVDPKILKIDGNNPNKLDKKTMKALKQNIIKYGWNMPIITDMDYMVADGEQKLTAAKEMEIDKVPVLRNKNIKTDADRLIIRQSMNKIRGVHDRTLDGEEFKKILETVQMDDLTALTAIDDQEIINLISSLEEDNTKLPSDDGVDTLYKQLCECPKCHHKFSKKKVE